MYTVQWVVHDYHANHCVVHMSNTMTYVYMKVHSLHISISHSTRPHTIHIHTNPPPPLPPPPAHHTPPPHHHTHQAIFTAILAVYLMLYCYYLWMALHLLKQLPYNRYQMSNVTLRLSMRETLVVMSVGIAVLIVDGFIHFGMWGRVFGMWGCVYSMVLGGE